MKSNTSKLVKNSALLMIGNFSSKLLVFLLVPFYTSVLSTEEYGISDILVTTINLIYPILSLMIETAVLRFCLDENPDRKTVFSTALWINMIGFSVLVPLAVAIIPHTTLKDYLPYFLGYYVTHTAYVILMNYTKGIGKVSYYSITSVLNTAIVIFCNLLFLLQLKIGVQGYLLSMIIGYLVSSAFIIIATKAWRDVALPGKLDSDLTKKMIKYSLPLIPNSLSWWISNSSDRYILAFFRSMSDVGIYTVSYKIPSIITVVSNILMNAWEISAVDDFGTEKNRLFFSKMYRNYLNLQIICCAIIMVLVKPLAVILFQKDFYDAWLFVPALLYASIFNTLNNFVGTVFTAAKKTKSLFTTTLIGALVNIGLNFCLIPFWGAQGAAVATAISYITIYVLRMIKSSKIIKLDINMFDNVLKLVLVGGLAVAACINTIASVVLCVVILILEYKFIANLVTAIISKLRKKLKK